jgi:hypothetical protein
MTGSLIPILIMVAWAIITAVAQAQNKKKNAKPPIPRPPQQGVGRVPAGQPKSGPIAQGRSKLDQLTARRKAQLDQLRRQREGGGSGSTPIEVQPMQTPYPKREQKTIEIVPLGRQTSPVTPERRTIKVVQATREGLHASREREVEQRAAARDSRREVVERPAKPAIKRKQVVRAVAAPPSSAPLTEPSGAPPTRSTDAFAIAPMPQPDLTPYRMSRSAPLTSGEAIRMRLKDRQLLRDLVVMKEIFDPPVAIREKHLA